MRSRFVLLGLVLCALPANGSPPTDEEELALTPIDELPTKDAVITLVGTDPIPRLRELVLGKYRGVEFRAMRALPQFCTPTCKVLDVNDPPHPAREVVLTALSRTPGPGQVRAGEDILRLRAGIETLGLMRSGAQSDLVLLVHYLDDASRDVRAAAAHALGVFCHPAADVSLAARHANEETLQVKAAIEKARDSLETCTPP
jgi:hypothetical protein